VKCLTSTACRSADEQRDFDLRLVLGAPTRFASGQHIVTPRLPQRAWLLFRESVGKFPGIREWLRPCGEPVLL
jgi:hypothetical protein